MKAITPRLDAEQIPMPDQALLEQLAADPVYAEFQRLLDLEARTMLALADVLHDPVLGERVRAHADFERIQGFCVRLDRERGTVARAGRESTPTALGIAIKRVQIETPALAFCELVTALAAGAESRTLERCQHLRAAIWISRREAEPGSAYSVAIGAAARAARGERGPEA